MSTNENKKCQICKEIPTYLCYDCKNYYCDKCFKFIHDIQVNPNHKREKIDSLIQVEFKWFEHPEHPICLFCAEEKDKTIFLIFYFIIL